MTVHENFNGITVRELKTYLEKCENLDGEVWLEEYETGLTNVAKSIWPLNTNDILIGSNLSEERIDKMSILIQALQDLAEYDCAYGDGCSEFVATRHGICVGCKARKTLQQCGIEIRK